MNHLFYTTVCLAVIFSCPILPVLACHWSKLTWCKLKGSVINVFLILGCSYKPSMSVLFFFPHFCPPPHRCQDKEQTITVINVYCPRADPEKPERKQFKLQFYKLLQRRAEALLKDGRWEIFPHPAFAANYFKNELFWYAAIKQFTAVVCLSLNNGTHVPFCLRTFDLCFMSAKFTET